MIEIGNVSAIGILAAKDGIVSGEAVLIYILVVYGVICQIINVFGVITNIINIISYAKMGLKDSANICLLGLSISDLGSLITMMWTCLFATPSFFAANLPFDSMDTAYLISGMVHLNFFRISCCITAMITIERCLCTIFPLKIKNISTPRRALGINISIFVICFSSATPVWVVNRLGPKFLPLRNKTIIGLVSTDNHERVELFTFAVNNFAIPFFAFFIIVICTILLSFKLRDTSKWREKIATGKQSDRISCRNINVAKIVVMISTFFILCFVPMCLIMLTIALVPGFSLQGKYVGIGIMFAGVSYILECVNSSMNIFIYYRMSSKYREVFLKLVFCSKIITD